MPRAEDIDLEGLDIDINDLRAMQTVGNADVKAEILSQEELFLKLAGDLPKEMIFQRELLISRL
jgi:phosphoenolpyruvate carboxykinase (GTP)